MEIKKSNKLSKENVNVLNTPIWTSPKRNDKKVDIGDPFEGSLDSASKHIEKSLTDLDDLISQRKKELNSIRLTKLNLDENGIKSIKSNKSSSGSKRIKSTKKSDNDSTSPSIDTPSTNGFNISPISSNAPTPIPFISSSVDTSPNDSPLMVKISRYALNDLYNREKSYTQSLKEANSRISYLELCHNDKDIHIESLNITITEMQAIRAEMEIDASIKENKFKEEINILKSRLKSRDDINTNSVSIEDYHQKLNELSGKTEENEILRKKCASLESKLVSRDNELIKKLTDSYRVVEEYKHREKELKALFDGTITKVEELKLKGDHYYKLCKDYKKKIKVFENGIKEAEARAKDTNRQQNTNDDDNYNEDLLLLTKKVKDTEEACLLFKGLYEEAVQENEVWVMKMRQLEASALVLDEEKKALECTIFELEVSRAETEQELETARNDLEKVKNKSKKMKAGLASMADVHDETNSTNALLSIIKEKDDELNNLNLNIQRVLLQEEDLANAYLEKDKDFEELQISYYELEQRLQKATVRINSLEDELDGVIMEKLGDTKSYTPISTPASNSSPNPFATPYNKHDATPNTNDKNNFTIENNCATCTDDQDIEETLLNLLVSEAEDAYKANKFSLAVQKFKEAGLKGIQIIQQGSSTDKETKQQLKELISRCLQNAEGISNQMKSGSDSSSTKKIISSDCKNKEGSGKSEQKSEFNFVKPLIIIAVVGTIFMIGIFIALIARFEANRPDLKPKYIWPHEIDEL